MFYKTYSCISDLILVLRILHGAYSDTKVPVGTTEILRNVYWYCGTYSCISDLILVLRILHGAYYDTKVPVGTTEILRNVYWYCGTYSCISYLIHVLQSIYLSYGSYTCVTKLILVFQILFMCEGTHRYDKSEHIRIISHARSNQTYADTYQIWTLVHSTYRSQQIHIPDSYRFRTYPKTNRLSVYIIIIFRVTLARRYP